MRAVLRADIMAGTDFPKKDNREQFDRKVIDLFKEIGYSPRSRLPKEEVQPKPKDEPLGVAGLRAKDGPKEPRLNQGIDAAQEPLASEQGPFDWKLNQDMLQNSAVVTRIFKDVPSEVAEVERQHLIMAGYTAEGQMDFVVCVVNEREIHIRARKHLFDLLRRGCHDMYEKVTKSSRRSWRLEGTKDTWVRIPLPLRPKVYLRLRHQIEVLEPAEATPTIVGHVVDKPFRVAVTQNYKEVTIASLLFASFIVLFIYTPSLAGTLASWQSHYSALYLQGLLERVGSALFVTSMVTTLDIVIKYLDLRRIAPIRWNTGIEPEIRSGNGRA